MKREPIRTSSFQPVELPRQTFAQKVCVVASAPLKSKGASLGPARQPLAIRGRPRAGRSGSGFGFG